MVGGTVYMCTADKDGNMVSHIQSNYMNFGSGVVIPGTGIALHNRGNNFSLDENHDNIVEPFKKPVSHIQSNYMNFGSGVVIPGTGIALHNRGNNFSLDENHDNIVEPFKKPYHTIIPGFIKQNDEAVGAFGVMGAFMQPQGQFQAVTNLIDFNDEAVGAFGVMGAFMQPQGQFQAVTNLIDFAMNPQEALDAPRWQWIDGIWCNGSIYAASRSVPSSYKFN